MIIEEVVAIVIEKLLLQLLLITVGTSTLFREYMLVTVALETLVKITDVMTPISVRSLAKRFRKVP